MRLRTCNSRRKRLFCRQKEPKGKPFCYIVYGKRVTRPIKVTDSEGFSWTVDWEVMFKEWKRSFDNYPEAIAHLTRVKLAIDEEDREWQSATPCKIVEGMYTKSGKEVITKIIRLNNECDRPPERHFSSGLPRQQRRINFPVQQTMAGSYYWDTLRSSGPTTGSNTTTGVVTKWDGLPFSALV